MGAHEDYDYILIRDSNILVRVLRGAVEEDDVEAEFFDVRTGVQLKEIHPALQSAELRRGYLLPIEYAASILADGTVPGEDLAIDFSKVVSIQEVKQRRLDSVVADSILDQLRIVSGLLSRFLDAADTAGKEQRFWMARQILPTIRKFSGRELEELEDVVEWLTRPKK
ncbi:MAG: hypothetical protein HY914_21040 [Desulfomonile tiedjei]|nr:hypothetical protein [Desulfomonile tiedjei]